MDLLLLALVAIGLLFVLVLVIYLFARVEALERSPKTQPAQGGEAAKASGPFGGLAGRALWDALSGAAPGEHDEDELQRIRQRYAAVLSRHIELVFEQGRQDARAGGSGQLRNPMRITALRGAVESWLPDAELQLIHRCGRETVTSGPGSWGQVRVALDEAAGRLFAAVRLEAGRRFSDSLIGPDPDSIAQSGGADAAPTPATPRGND